MSPEMKQEAVASMEALRGMSVAEYKSKRFEEMETVIADAQNNPGNHSKASLRQKYRELLGGYEVPEEIERRFMLVEKYISIRGMEVKKSADEGFIKLNENLTYDDFSKGNYRT